MAIIWDIQNPNDPKHKIRINGNHILDIKSSYIQYSALSNTELEDEIKEDADPKLEPEDREIYAHVFTKDPVNYTIWVGPLGSEPSAPPGYDWWENWGEL